MLGEGEGLLEGWVGAQQGFGLCTPKMEAIRGMIRQPLNMPPYGKPRRNRLAITLTHKHLEPTVEKHGL